jgi:hypothetical protein
LYKEDFNKFIRALGEAVDYVKTELMPDFNFDAFNHDEVAGEHEDGSSMETEVREIAPVEEISSDITAEMPVQVESVTAKIADTSASEEVDKW